MRNLGEGRNAVAGEKAHFDHLRLRPIMLFCVFCFRRYNVMY